MVLLWTSLLLVTYWWVTGGGVPPSRAPTRAWSPPTSPLSTASGCATAGFCARPLLARLGAPEGALRASVGVGTTTADVDRLLGGLAAYLGSGPSVPYAVVGGRWQPADDPRPLAGLAGADLRAVTRGGGCGPAVGQTALR